MTGTDSVLFSCAYCDRAFPTPLGLELHGVRVHRRRILLEESETSPVTAEPAAPTEGESIFQVSLTLPENDWLRMIGGGSREGQVRSVLASARRKAARDPNATEDSVAGEFWDGRDRRILRELRARGVRLRVEDEVHGG
jgi:hypothetical protein